MNDLIDTNIISEVRKGRRCDPNVARWYEKIDDVSLYLSVLVISEIRSGAEKVRAKDTKKANALEQWLIAVDKAFGERILPVDRAVANVWGRLSANRPLPVIDGLLAATAKIHRMTLVTRNTDDIADLDVSILNPFELRSDILRGSLIFTGAFLAICSCRRFPGDNRTMYGMRANLLKIKDESFRAAREFWDAQKRGSA